MNHGYCSGLNRLIFQNLLALVEFDNDFDFQPSPSRQMIVVFCGGEGCSLAKSCRDWMCGWCVESVRGPYGVSLWKFISQGWVKFEYFICFLVGNSSRGSLLAWSVMLAWNYFKLQKQRQQWQTIWRLHMVLFYGILHLLKLFIIGVGVDAFFFGETVYS